MKKNSNFWKKHSVLYYRILQYMLPLFTTLCSWIAAFAHNILGITYSLTTNHVLFCFHQFISFVHTYKLMQIKWHLKCIYLYESSKNGVKLFSWKLCNTKFLPRFHTHVCIAETHGYRETNFLMDAMQYQCVRFIFPFCYITICKSYNCRGWEK